MMQTGLLIFDNSKKRSLSDKVWHARNAYKQKFGKVPNTCYVNKDDIDGIKECDGINLISSSSTLKNHFWIGIADKS